MPLVKNIAVVILAATGLLTMGALPVAAQRATTDNHIMRAKPSTWMPRMETHTAFG